MAVLLAILSTRGHRELSGDKPSHLGTFPLHGLPPVSQAPERVRQERGQKDALTQVVRGRDGKVRVTWKSGKEV